MHELSLARGILDIVEAERKKNGFTRVLEISLKVGEYSGIVPRCLEEFFPIAAGDGAANEAPADAAETAETEQPAQTEYKPDHRWWSLLLQIVYGAVACSTMIIPGISGSLVMVMMGQYQNIMDAIKHFDILTLLPFGIGCLIGLIFCAKLIRWLLEKHSQLTYSAILGFVLGSILPVFPGWSAVFSVGGIIAFLIGGACIVGCELLSRRFAK